MIEAFFHVMYMFVFQPLPKRVDINKDDNKWVLFFYYMMRQVLDGFLLLLANWVVGRFSFSAAGR